MKFAGYKRAETKEGARAFGIELRRSVEQSGDEFAFFAWDLSMGQRGLLRAVKAAKSGKVQGVVVDELKDLARDLVSLVKTLSDLLDKGATVKVISTRLFIEPPVVVNGENPENRMVRALMAAHAEYANSNRKNAIAAAKAAGASVGRPVTIELDDARDEIEAMAKENGESGPSVRALAKRLGCSEGKSAKLLRAWRAENDAFGG